MDGMWNKSGKGRNEFIQHVADDLARAGRYHESRYGSHGSAEDYAQAGAVRILEEFDNPNPSKIFEAVIAAEDPTEAAERARGSHLPAAVTGNPARVDARQKKKRKSLADVPEQSITVPHDKQRELTEFLEHLFVNVIRPAKLSETRYMAAVNEICRQCGVADLDDESLNTVAMAAGVDPQGLRLYVNTNAIKPTARKAWGRAKADLGDLAGLRETILGLVAAFVVGLASWAGGGLVPDNVEVLLSGRHQRHQNYLGDDSGHRAAKPIFELSSHQESA